MKKALLGISSRLHCTVGMYVVVWKTEGPVGIVVLSVLFCNREMPKTSFEAFLCSVGAFTMAEIAQVCPKTISHFHVSGQLELLGTHIIVGLLWGIFVLFSRIFFRTLGTCGMIFWQYFLILFSDYWLILFLSLYF